MNQGVKTDVTNSFSPWKVQHQPTGDIWYTSKKTEQSIFAIFFDWPENDKLVLDPSIVEGPTKVTLLETKLNTEFEKIENKLYVSLPRFRVKWGEGPWVLKLHDVS